MPHARQLSMDERRIILNLHERGDSTSEIASAVGRVRGTVLNVIRNPDKQRALPRSGRPTKLTEQDKRNLFRKARTGRFYAREIVQDLNLSITVPYAQQLLSNDKHLIWRTMKKKPSMTSRHFHARKLWAENHLSWDQVQWNRVIWSDEKKFNLDGPDGSRYYWHDRRIPRKLFSKRHSGGGSVMVWGCFSSAGVGELSIIEGRLTSASYISVLENSLLPFAYAYHGVGFEDFYFQHDGAPAHTAIRTKNWLNEVGVQCISWPSVSPDLNPIENLWGVLAQNVYKHGRQFGSKDALQACIIDTWNNISQDLISALTTSMRRRCIDVLRKNGRAIDY